MSYPKAPDDQARVKFLHGLSILDTGPDQQLEHIVRLCKEIFSVPIATISLVDEDRQWFKVMDGLDVCETDREQAFCNYTILGDGIFEVTDASIHPDFQDNALVTGDPFIRYYAGAPLIFDGVRLGSLCLIDLQPREPLTESQRRILTELAALVIREFRVQRVIRESIAHLVGGTS